MSNPFDSQREIAHAIVKSIFDFKKAGKSRQEWEKHVLTKYGVRVNTAHEPYDSWRYCMLDRDEYEYIQDKDKWVKRDAGD